MDNTRMIFMGDPALANGFRLAGFEVFPEADQSALERLLIKLRDERHSAFVVLDHHLAECNCGVLRELREEGGRVLITQVSPLYGGESVCSSVDERIAQMLGQEVMP